MNKLMAIGIGALLLLLLLVFSTTYTVSYHEVAIKRTFGKSDADSVRKKPGLKWKLPIVQSADTFDTRLQIKETTLQEVSTADGQQVVVRAFMLWQIETDGDGPIQFDKQYNSIPEAGAGLTAPLITAVGGALGQYNFDDLIGPDNRLDEAEGRIKANLDQLNANGIRTVAVGISQLLLPERTTNSVTRRMEATRSRLAEAKRFQGQARAAQIKAQAATLADKIRAFADLRAADIRSEAAEKTGEYLAQMSEEEELAIFLVWLDTLEASLSESSTFILPTNFEPWHLLDTTGANGADGVIPRATRGTGGPGGSNRAEGRNQP